MAKKITSIDQLDAYIFGKEGAEHSNVKAHGRKFKLQGVAESPAPADILELCNAQTQETKISFPKQDVAKEIVVTRNKSLASDALGDVFTKFVELSDALSSQEDVNKAEMDKKPAARGKGANVPNDVKVS